MDTFFYSEKIVTLIYLSELEKLHVSYTEETFKKCNKEGLVKGLWRNHSHEAQVRFSSFSLQDSILILNALSVRIFTVFGRLLKNRVLHKEAWVAKLLGTHISIQVHKKVKFLWRDNSSLAVKGLKK